MKIDGKSRQNELKRMKLINIIHIFSIKLQKRIKEYFTMEATFCIFQAFIKA